MKPVSTSFLHPHLLLLALIITTTPSYGRRNFALTDNGYDILVGIHDDVPEDNALLDDLKDILTKASKRLYGATKRRAYFKTISILVPNSWNGIGKEKAGKERYTDAEIVVAAPNMKYGDAPYVKALSSDCGAAGENIHLTPDYVADLNGARRKYGDPGKVILHEWGHLRWGLPEEYPDPLGSLRSKFYFSRASKRFEAIRCSASTAGKVVRPIGVGKWESCRLNRGLPTNKQCQFFPGFQVENKAKVSVMDRQGTDQVWFFSLFFSLLLLLLCCYCYCCFCAFVVVFF